MSKYKLRKPEKVGFKNKTRGGHQALILRDDSPSPYYPIMGVIIKKDRTVFGSSWTLDGAYKKGRDTAFDLIPLKDKKHHFDDLTQIDVPFGELDKDTQKRLKAWPHGVEFRNSVYNWARINASFYEYKVYRALPEPTENPKPEYELNRWYPYTGDKCPVPDDAQVKIFCTYEDVVRKEVRKASDYLWEKNGRIVAFKVVSYA